MNKTTLAIAHAIDGSMQLLRRSLQDNAEILVAKAGQDWNVFHAKLSKYLTLAKPAAVGQF